MSYDCARKNFRMRSFIILPLLLLSALATRASDRTPPARPFSTYPAPAPPDYARTACWAAHPAFRDSADLTPPGVPPQSQENAAADVFFIHPTTLLSSQSWNAALDDSLLNLRTDRSTIRHQASIFNRAGRVFAPRYRQMCLGGFWSRDTASTRQALALAYTDVRAAFLHFLETENQGRPIIIAAHSQGSVHALRLLKEFFDGKPLQQRLVIAYVAGWPFPESFFSALPICDGPESTGCVVGWNSWREGVIPRNYDTYYLNAVAVSPITWRRDTLPADESLHQGFLWGDYRKMRTAHLYAYAKGGILWVKRALPLAPTRNYHQGDYNLFWLDIRHNASLRVDAFLTQSRS
jgi:hypothetical protein